MNREEIKQLLLKNVAAVTFTKANGDTRVLNCTLQASIVPQPEVKETSTVTRPVNEQVLAVWDVDNTAWRSFRIDSVTSVA